MALTEGQKTKARELKDLDMSYRDIAEAIGSNKDAVSRYFKTLATGAGGGPELSQKCDNSSGKNSPARVRAIKGAVAKPSATDATKCDKSATRCDSVAGEPDRQAMASMAYEDVQTMRDRALAGLEAVAGITDMKERTWMETAYLKMLEKSTRMLGTWGGLDEMTARENEPLEAFTEAMDGVDTGDVSDWEVKG